MSKGGWSHSTGKLMNPFTSVQWLGNLSDIIRTVEGFTADTFAFEAWERMTFAGLHINTLDRFQLYIHKYLARPLGERTYQDTWEL